MTDLDTRLSKALCERMAHEHADVDRLADVSIRAGTRLRRRRRAAVGVGTAGVVGAAVTALAVGGLLGSTPRAVDGPGLASTPSATSDSDDCAEGVVQDDWTIEDLREYVAANDASCLPIQELRSLGSGDVVDEPAHPKSWDLPASLDLPGWECEPPASDKMACNSADGSVTLVVRPSGAHHTWTKDPDKGGDPGTVWVSPIHENCLFVSVQGTLGSTALVDFIDALKFEPNACS